MDKKPTKSFFGRLGGKSRLAKCIVDQFPLNYQKLLYVEPFAGAGSVFWRKEPSEIDVVNDLNKDIYDLWRDMKVVGETVQDMDFKIDTVNHYETLRNKTVFDTSTERLYRNLYVSKWSFGTMRGSWVGPAAVEMRKNSNIGKYLRARCLAYKKALEGVTILNSDFRHVLRLYDSPKTLFYLDPPYPTFEQRSVLWSYLKDQSSLLDPEDVLKAVQPLEGKWVLSYADTPKIRRLFQDYFVRDVTTGYTIGRGRKNDWATKELLIRNY